MNPAEKIKDWSGRSQQFYTDIRSELRKVSWPSRQEVVGTTMVVVVAVFFFGFYLGLVDFLLSRGLQWVITYFGGEAGA